jgi:hypothetical protein
MSLADQLGLTSTHPSHCHSKDVSAVRWSVQVRCRCSLSRLEELHDVAYLTSLQRDPRLVSSLHPARLSAYRTMSAKSARSSALRAATSAYSGGPEMCTRSCPCAQSIQD